MLSGLKFIIEDGNDFVVKADDDDEADRLFDNEDDFLANAANYMRATVISATTSETALMVQ